VLVVVVVVVVVNGLVLGSGQVGSSRPEIVLGLFFCTKSQKKGTLKWITVPDRWPLLAIRPRCFYFSTASSTFAKKL
jgi:hypothetical protein